MPSGRLPACLAGALFAAASALPAAAAPQILALLATDTAIPLTCEDGACTAEFSGFCLQRKRPEPPPGARYLAAGGEVTLIVTGTDGAVRRMPARDHIVIETSRSYTAVRIAVAQRLLTEWDAVSLALQIGERVALIPIPEAMDPDPQTEADIALALGPQHALGERILADSPAETGAVALTNRMIAALPAGRTDAATRTALWDRVVTSSTGNLTPAGVARAAAIYQRCLAKVASGSFYSLRSCLEIGHDALMIDLNVKYWKAGPES
ncbi:MAG: hypothetical protein JSU82_12850 [Rhodospirillales bacterium]|nr:MAG: hypothetical protein JSU82_12850 [Rhodospirillales bacterium]